ncbi:MAG TPA: site-specific integrase, partial [Burkholderiaceae bacterium]
ARWSEIDMDAKVWRIPAERMKARRPHDVPLSTQALAVLDHARGLDAELVFPSSVRGSDGQTRPLSNMAMLTALSRHGLRRRTTVHGLARATFSTWANERGIARPDVVEAALAHAEGDKTRAAYNRASFDDERRALLQAWGDYLVREAAQVVVLRAA